MTSVLPRALLYTRAKSSTWWQVFPGVRYCGTGGKMSAGGGRSGRTLIGVCQMTSRSDKEDNFEVYSELIERATTRGAKLVFLPEGFDYLGGGIPQTLSMAETLDGQLMTRISALAKKHDVWLSLGGFHEKGSESDSSRVYNTHVMMNDQGAIVATYRKTHLFHVDIPGQVRLKETDWTIPGGEIVAPVPTPAGKVGLAICYDLRFPELCISLAQMGADILTFPSAFTQTTGMAHWEVLLRARAIENQCYVVAAAQTGAHSEKRRSYGHAMVVDPWGCVVACCHEGTDVCVAEVDLDYLHKVRREMPVWEHRRHDIYGHIELKT
ncbi:deaminated glutathione amidase-like isoform X1 [Branchiostoma lanceolatum]|uniref:deaminated glutathione amidase-like isoform X1 n=1 Tax=Branchiostoma lanceolatum TaxID=7740 RepID=UPI003451F69E